MTPDYLSPEDRQALLQNIEGLQRRLSLIAHTLISQPTDPLPAHAWNCLDMTFLAIAPITQRWVN